VRGSPVDKPGLGTGDMTHRFFQAAQQQDCSLANATKANPTGCLNDLFAFVLSKLITSAMRALRPANGRSPPSTRQRERPERAC
jgi:hypothetical protein